MSNPTKAPQGKGARNFNCPHYNDCLDIAVDREWPGWSCQKCRHKQTGDRIPEAVEVFPYYLLLAALFSPIPYCRYRTLDQKDRFRASWRKKKAR